MERVFVTNSDASHSAKNTTENVVAIIKGVDVLAAPHLKRSIVDQIRRGVYERPEIEFGLANLRPGDRVMEMGTGAGVVGSVFLKNVDDLTLRSFEANPDLIDYIRKLYAHNRLDDSASVTNNVVVSGNNAPEYMDFHVRPNFLGSRLSAENNEPNARKLSIPTKHYDSITHEFPHNVLVMDIEGGELDFLADADLSGVELVMLELHPKVYGEQGRKQVVEHLTNKGFILDQVTSSGQVASFKTSQRMNFKPDLSHIEVKKPVASRYDLDPNQPLSGEIITVENAVLAKTPHSQGDQIAASAFDAARNHLPQAVCWISQRRPSTLKRSHPRENRIQALPGTWLFGGRFASSFGHFLCETLARVWALDHIDTTIDGVLFFPAHNGQESEAEKLFSQLSEILDIPINYKICDKFYRVDRLIIPPQGSGLGRLMASSPEMRDFVTDHLIRGLKPVEDKKIYISRSGEFGKVGRRFLGEEHLEKLLKAEGYTIFHPEEYSWEDQLRHYLSATHILGADGSPFHLVNFTGRADLNVGIIQRRPTHDARQMVNQGNLYGIENAYRLSHLGRYWACSGRKRAGTTIVSELDFAALCEELKLLGFLSKNASLKNLTEAALKKELNGLAQKAGTDIRLVEGLRTSLAQYPECEVQGQPQAHME